MASAPSVSITPFIFNTIVESRGFSKHFHLDCPSRSGKTSHRWKSRKAGAQALRVSYDLSNSDQNGEPF